MKTNKYEISTPGHKWQTTYSQTARLSALKLHQSSFESALAYVYNTYLAKHTNQGHNKYQMEGLENSLTKGPAH